MADIPKFKANLAQNQVSVVPASGLRAEAGALGDSANVLGQIATETRQAEELEKVKIAQIEGQEKGRELLSSGAKSIDYLKGMEVSGSLEERQAYENGVMSSMQFKLSQDLDNRLAELSQTHANDPAGFQQSSNIYLNELVKQAPVEYQQSIFEMGMRRKLNLETQISNSRKAAERKTAYATHESALSAAVGAAAAARASGDETLFAERTAEAFAVVDAEYKAGLIVNEEAYQLKRQEVQRKIIQEGVMQGLDMADDRDAYVDDLSKTELPGYTPAMKRDLLKSVSAYKKNLDYLETDTREKLKLETDRAKAEKLSNLELSVESGVATVADIERAWEDQTIKSASKRTELYKKLQETQELNLKRNKVDNRLLESLDTGMPMDRGNPDHVDAVDRYFTNIESNIEGMDATNYSEVVSRVIDSTGITPSSVVGLIRNSASSATPEQMSKAAAVYSKVQERDPDVLNDMDESERYALSTYNSLLKAGMSMEESFASVREQLARADTGATQINTQKLKELDFKYASEALNAVDESWFGGPDVPTDERLIGSRLSSDYKAVFDQAFIASGDKDYAKKRAESVIKRSWGVTEVDGSERVMKYAPEKYYSIRGDGDWLKEDLISSVKSHPTLQGAEIEEGDILINSDSRTARTAQTGKPDYVVMIRTSEGLIEPLRSENGYPLRWAPDYEQKLEKQNAELIQEGQKARDRDVKRGQWYNRIINKDLSDLVYGVE